MKIGSGEGELLDFLSNSLVPAAVQLSSYKCSEEKATPLMVFILRCSPGFDYYLSALCQNVIKWSGFLL